MKPSKKSLNYHLLTNTRFGYLIWLLLVTACQDVFAVSKYYVFEGKLTYLQEPYTRTATKAGYELNDFIHYVVEIDFDRQGFYISSTSGGLVTPSDSDTIDYFYANLISGTEIIHIGTPGVVYDNFGANYTDGRQSFINLANYLVLLNDANPIDWRIGDEVRSSDRWTVQAYEQMDGRLTLVDISDSPPTVEYKANNWATIQFNREITNFMSKHPVNNSVFVSARPYGGLYEKSNNSLYFSSRNAGLADTNVKDLAYSPDSAVTLYAATIHGGVYKSTNGGASWVQSNSGIQTRSNQSTDVYSLAVSPSDADVIYAGTLFGMYKSVDAGSNWQLEATPFNDSVINAIQVTAQNEIIAGTDKGLFKGVVGSNTWLNLLNNAALISNKAASISDIKLHPTNQNIMAVGIQGFGAYLYYIDSDSWEKLNTGPANMGEDFLIEFAGVSGDAVYVVASDTGLYRSDDFNRSWNQVVLPTVKGHDVSVNSFVVDLNEQIVIGSNHNGVYSIEKSLQSTSPVTSPDPNKSVSNNNSSGSGTTDMFMVLIFGLFMVIRCRINSYF